MTRPAVGPVITVVRGDITGQPVKAVVTAANSALRSGTGVNGAVHAAAGPQLLKASRALAPCPPGHAVITPAFGLSPIKWVIHVVGPRYTGLHDAAVLASTYTAALARADEVGAESLAFAAISTGVYGYPPDEAAQISVDTLRYVITAVRTVLLVAFDDHTERLWWASLSFSHHTA